MGVSVSFECGLWPATLSKKDYYAIYTSRLQKWNSGDQERNSLVPEINGFPSSWRSILILLEEFLHIQPRGKRICSRMAESLNVIQQSVNEIQSEVEEVIDSRENSVLLRNCLPSQMSWVPSLVSFFLCDLLQLRVITTFLPAPRCPEASGLRHLLSNPLMFLCLMWVEGREGGVSKYTGTVIDLFYALTNRPRLISPHPAQVTQRGQLEITDWFTWGSL